MIKRASTRIKHSSTALVKNSNITFRDKKYFLGLDISSAKTGYSVLNDAGTAVECGLIDTQHIFDSQEFGLFMKENFRNIAQRFKSEDEQDEWIVGAEEFLLKFNDKSTANTIAKLSNCNTLACYECRNELPVKKLFKFNVNAARSFFDIKREEKKSEKKTKMNVFNKLQHLLPQGYEIRYGRNGNLHESNFDVTDSLLISIYTFVKYNACENTISFLDLVSKHKDKSIRQELIELSTSINPEITQDMDNDERILYLLDNYSTARDHLFILFKKNFQKEYGQYFNININ